jgi:hypothetical protein
LFIIWFWRLRPHYNQNVPDILYNAASGADILEKGVVLMKIEAEVAID